MIARHAAAWSLLGVAIFCLSWYTPVFFGNDTVSAFDACYFAMPAYREHKPPGLHRPSNRLLGDPVKQFQPWDILMYEGKIPFPWLWNPYAGFGAPLLGNAISSPFFPLKWVAYAAGVRKGFGYLCFLKMLLAGIFTWLYLRKLGLRPLARLLGSVCFMASGFMVAWLQWPMTGAALFVPLLLLGCEQLAERQPVGFPILVTGIAASVLAGHPETTFHSLVAAALYLLIVIPRRHGAGPDRHRVLRPCLIFIAACILGFLIAGVQLLPMLEYVFHSAVLRARRGTPQQWVTPHWFLENWEYARREILSYIVPDTWGNPSLQTSWWNHFSNFNESAGYTGAGVLLLSLIAWRYFREDRHIRALCTLQALSLVFILRVTPLGLNAEALPVFSLAANKRFLLIFCFSNASLAAIVFDGLGRKQKTPFDVSILLWTLAAALMACALRDYFSRFAGDPHAWIRLYGRKQLVHLAWALLPWPLLCCIPPTGPRLRAAALASLVALAAADLFVIHHRYNPFIDADELYPAPKVIAFLQSRATDGAPVRVMPLGRPLAPNLTALYDIDSPFIYDAIMASWYKDFSDAYPARSWDSLRDLPRGFASAASIQYLWAKAGDAAAADDLPLRYADSGSRIYENTGALPRAYLATSWRRVASSREAIRALKDAPDPWKAPTLVECGTIPGNAPRKAGGGRIVPARITRYSPHSVSVEIPGGGEGFLVLNDLYFPGWTARCGGVRRDISRVNGIFRGVWIGGDERTVEFIYVPSSFSLGASLSCAGIGIFAVILIRSARRKRALISVKDKHDGSKLGTG